VPGYGADGDVVNISLHAIKIQNADKTFTVIPHTKSSIPLIRTGAACWRAGRERIQRSVLRHDQHKSATKICYSVLKRIDLIQDYLETKMHALDEYQGTHHNTMIHRWTVPRSPTLKFSRLHQGLLKKRTDIHHDGMPFLVRTLSPNPTGLPMNCTSSQGQPNGKSMRLSRQRSLTTCWQPLGTLTWRREPTGMDFASLPELYH
jgi:miniconductance mechanosensitive channel